MKEEKDEKIIQLLQRRLVELREDIDRSNYALLLLQGKDIPLELTERIHAASTNRDTVRIPRYFRSRKRLPADIENQIVLLLEEVKKANTSYIADYINNRNNSSWKNTVIFSLLKKLSNKTDAVIVMLLPPKGSNPAIFSLKSEEVQNENS